MSLVSKHYEQGLTKNSSEVVTTTFVTSRKKDQIDARPRSSEGCGFRAMAQIACPASGGGASGETKARTAEGIQNHI